MQIGRVMRRVNSAISPYEVAIEPISVSGGTNYNGTYDLIDDALLLTKPGSYKLTPGSKTTKIYVFGSAGGGTGSANSVSNGGGGGGGGGEHILSDFGEAFNITVTPGEEYTMVVGGAGEDTYIQDSLSSDVFRLNAGSDTNLITGGAGGSGGDGTAGGNGGSGGGRFGGGSPGISPNGGGGGGGYGDNSPATPGAPGGNGSGDSSGTGGSAATSGNPSDTTGIVPVAKANGGSPTGDFYGGGGGGAGGINFGTRGGKKLDGQNSVAGGGGGGGGGGTGSGAGTGGTGAAGILGLDWRA